MIERGLKNSFALISVGGEGVKLLWVGRPLPLFGMCGRSVSEGKENALLQFM